jgi:hemoglobin-like flavoprotein
VTEEDRQLVQQSWDRIAPSGEETISEFDDRLFKNNPELRSLFPPHLHEQRMKLVAALTFAIHAVGDSAKLRPVLRELGKRHRAYGVRSVDYEAVGDALLQTLKSRLDKAFTSDVRRAWRKTYGTLAAMMQSS